MRTKLVNENFSENYLENLLKARGIENVEEYKNPTMNHLQPPSNLKNIGQAAALYTRIVLQPKPRILVIVDPDVDGFTSATIIYKYTLEMNCHAQIDYWLHEGKAHGLSEHIGRLLESDINYDLLILPDSSSNDATYHDMLNDVHIPCLILDHHITDEALSDNAIVVNNQMSPNYTNKELTGAGVTWQFCRYIDEKIGQNWAEKYIDLAAWGIVADMGGMTNMENRYIVCKGFKQIKNELFRCLLEKTSYSITGKMGATWEDVVAKTNPISVAFYVVPMVNALIRVGTMEDKELLFRAFIDGAQMVPCNKRGAKGTLERADIEAARVCSNAKTHQNKMLDEVMIQIEAKLFKYDLLDNKILLVVLDEENFPSEINGLLAMRLAAKYHKPTMVVREGTDGFCKGSMRGLNQSELTDFKTFLTESNCIEWCRGHANAAGLCISRYNLNNLHQYANNALKDFNFDENVYSINFERKANATDLQKLIVDIGSAGDVWGQANSEPIIHITNLYLTKNDIRIMGKDSSTLKIESNGMSYLKFQAKDLIDKINSLSGTFQMEIIGRANINEYMGRSTPQVFIDDWDIVSVDTKSSIIDF